MIPIARRLPRLVTLCVSRGLATATPAAAGEVRIVEVGPRDGLQNEKKELGLQTKLDLIHRLSNTGVSNIEAGSFVSPKWVPQMANSAEVLDLLSRHPPTAPAPITYNYLVPNMKGLENYLKATQHGFSKPQGPLTPPPSSKPREQKEEAAPITSAQNPNEMPSSTTSTSPPSPPAPTTDISIFLSATESFSHANLNTTISSSLSAAQEIITRAKPLSIRVRGYISCALGCPYEGPNTSPTAVSRIATTLLEYGVDEVSVADTIGTGTAPKTNDLLKALFAAGIKPGDLALHFHDTYGQALVNALVGLEHGIRTFDSAVGGLGGCPFAGQATGNVSTEELVYLFESLGVKTGVDVEEMARIGDWICGELGRQHESRAGKAILSKLRKSD